MTQDSYIK